MAHREGITTRTHDWSMVPASSLIEDQNVIEIDGDTPVEVACSILVDNNISSAPVFKSADRSAPTIHSGKTYIGCVDYADIIAYLLVILRSSTADESGSLGIQDMVKRALQGQRVPVSMASGKKSSTKNSFQSMASTDMTSINTIDLSQNNPFCSILPEATLASVVDEFAHRIRRVSVMNPDGQIKGVLSQSTVVRYLYENRQQFPEIDMLMNKTLQELHLGESEVISVNSDTPVVEALNRMYHSNVSSVAVLNAEGLLVGNISLSDVKYVLKSFNHRLLWETSLRFACSIRDKQGIDDGQDRLPVFDVRLETTLGFAIAKLLATEAHHVWVTDKSGRAIGLLSLRDIFKPLNAISV